ncbi:hypothetical protein TNCV_2227791 [Trichonephila clavipes]|nr:hypothetical protein TNCV_2227791 [Trichonephila clavipes]
MKASSIFSPGEYLMRIILSSTSRLFTEKNTPPLLWCPQLVFSSPAFFPAGYSQSDALNWTPDAKVSLNNTAVDCLPGNSSS